MNQRILVPYDMSEQADYAITHALAFESAEIVLFHVIEPYADHTAAGGFDPVNYQRHLEGMEEQLETVASRYETDRIETVANYGRPIHQILGYIDREPIDQVVMGSHGRDGAARLLLGSVAETVARRSPVPVTVARPPANGQPNIEDVLVPFDMSPPARTALEYGLEQFPSATVTVLYVAYPATVQTGFTDDTFEILENWDEVRGEHADSVLNHARDIAEEIDREIETRTIEGKPEEAIVEAASEETVDHVVIGSFGRDGLSRLVLGSVAETILRRSPVSVTVVH